MYLLNLILDWCLILWLCFLSSNININNLHHFFSNTIKLYLWLDGSIYLQWHWVLMFTFLTFYWRIIYYSQIQSDWNKQKRLTSTWKIDAGSRYPLAISISMLQVSWNRKSLKSLFSSVATHGEEDDDPGAGVVVLAAAVDQADGVQQRGEQGPHICEVSRLKRLQRSHVQASLGSEADKPWSGTPAASGAGWCQRPHSALPHRSWTFPWKRIYK